jgi:hypothetical protein
MKVPFAIGLALCLAASAWAQAPGTGYSPDQLDQLLAPIALYPDPLIAIILPASTDPSDLALAEQYIAANGDPAGIDAQAWDPSVKALAHYPEVVKWMNDNADWTHSLGAAFAMQPSDVMKSVQQLRAQARAAGTLVDTPQQQVDVEGDDIRIVPGQPDTIYVPEYDPDVVYDAPDGYAGPFLTFGVGFPVGAWLGFECDWDDFGIWSGPWHPGWAYRRDWQDAHWGGQRWHVDPQRGRQLARNFYRPGAAVPTARFAGPARGLAQRPVATFHPSAAPAPDNYRGYANAAPRPSTPAPASPLFGGYSRGTQVRDYSNRGQTSRKAPVSRPARAPERAEAPHGGGGGGERH